jgi:predicted nucleic acid-binding protein
MIYIDSSCLVKLIRIEADSELVARAVDRENLIVVSALAELETLVELKAGHKAGDYSLPEWRKLELELHMLRNEAPFSFKTVPAGVWETAFRQHRNSRQIHCRALDRLHLAIMEKLGIVRLMTHDFAQAEGAKELGFEVLAPRAK